MSRKLMAPLALVLGCSGDAWVFRPLDAGAAPTDVSAPPDDQALPPSPDAATQDVHTDVMRPADDGMVVTPLDAMPSGPCYGRRGDSCCATSPQCMPGFECRGGTCQLIDDPPQCAGPERRGCDPATTALRCCDGLRCERLRGNPAGDLVCCGGRNTRCYSGDDCCSRLLCVDGLCSCVTRGECLTDDDCCSGTCDHSSGAVGRCM